MRLGLSVITMLCATVPALAGELSDQQKQTIIGFLNCGDLWGTVYGIKLSTEPAEDIAVAALQKCQSERNDAVDIIRASYSQQDWNQLVGLLDEKFRTLAITSVMDARMKAK